jgi:hypothetical protein
MPKEIEVSMLPRRTQIWFYALAFADVDDGEASALSAIEVSKHEGDSPLYRALIESSVIRFVRPFKRCDVPDGKHYVRLSRDMLPVGSEKFFEMLENNRDKVAAHSDLNARLVKIERAPDVDGQMIWTGHTSTHLLAPHQAEGLLEVCEAVKSRLLEVLRSIAGDEFRDMRIGEVRQIDP